MLLGTFRADEIVQQRNFMAALGGKGPGVFTQNPDGSPQQGEGVSEQEHVDGMKRAESTDMLARKVAYDSHVNGSANASNSPSYEWTMEHFPREFYHPQDYTANPDDMIAAAESTIKIAICDSTLFTREQRDSALYQRHAVDTFLPPYGPMHCTPVSIGYGSEVGLRPNLQAVWDPQCGLYYFLDHSTKTVFLEDPRPVDSVSKSVAWRTEEFTCDRSNCSNVTLPQVCEDTSVVQVAATRASQKPHGFVLKGVGHNGLAGSAGRKGQNGQEGSNGLVGVNGDGGDGTDGAAGYNGEDGHPGEKGSSGSDLSISLSGDVSAVNMCIDEQCCAIARLREDAVVFVDCRGGDGGEGGEGGVGGAGGKGGDGGNGGSRGCGGHGGDGGMGGSGGHGGVGGDAGNGGHCVIRTSDPRLLMLVEIDCRAGTSGRGGLGGSGDTGGRRGYGGDGGTWVELDSSPGAPEGAIRTMTGMRGKPGSSGSSGRDGQKGHDGKLGRDGGILWLIESATGDVLQESGVRYEAVVTSLKVTPPAQDELYEPNQPITISEVVIKNTGGLPLPEGAKVFFPTTESVRFEPITYELPVIPPNSSFSIPESFRGRIFDKEAPGVPGSFSGVASFSPRVELLGRPFENTLSKELPVAYPVKLSYALSRKNVGRGEISTLEIGVENTSSTSHGSVPGCKGSVAVRLHLDSRLTLVGVKKNSSDDEETLPFSVTHNPDTPDSIWVRISEVQPGEILTVPLVFLLDTKAQLCDICVWQADLHFKGKFIEYKVQKIRVTPEYSPANSPTSLGDVLMITNDQISSGEFALWQKIYDILDVNVDYWDASEDNDTPPEAERSSQRSPVLPTDHSVPPFELYTGRTIVYPHCKLDHIPSDYIIDHFNTVNSSTSSMLLFLESSGSKSLEEYYYSHSGHARIFRHLCRVEDRVSLPEDAHSGYHLLTPGTLASPETAIKRSETRIVKKLEHSSPSHALALFKGQSSNINHKGLWKYSYGRIDVRTFPIQRSCNLQCVDETGGNMTSMGADDPLLTVTSTEFPLASKFGQVFLAVLAAIPLKCKLNILKCTKSTQVKFHLPNGVVLNKQQLSAIAIAHTVADEVMNCNGSLSRMETVLDDLQANTNLYTRNSATHSVIKQMLALIQLEATHRARRFNQPAVSQAVKEIHALCQSVTDFDIPPMYMRQNSFTHSLLSVATEDSFSMSFLSPESKQDKPESERLPTLSVLQDSIQVLRTHQLLVEDDCYIVSR